MKALPRGMTLVDILVGSAIALMIFTAIFGLLRASAQVSNLSADTAAATAIANSQMEYIRSLDYDDVGTVGGIPAGNIAQNSTTTEDGVDYGVRTFIDYYDDPADGTGGSDANHITTDYKRVKVTVSFTASTGAKEISLVSNVTPKGLETTTGGGTLEVNVVDASGTAVPGASVTIENGSTSPAVDLTTFSDSTGTVYLPGASPATGYQVTVTKDGYSTAKTYDQNATNVSPSPGHLTVVKDTTTSATFAIDLLASTTFRTLAPIASGSWQDGFDDTAELASTDNAVVAGSALGLDPSALSGDARSVSIAPDLLASWGELSATPNVPAGTSAIVHVADTDGDLVPDFALPGNATGFSSFPVDLSALPVSTYPALSLTADFSTTIASTTPSLSDWSLSYRAGPTPVPNVSLSLTGAKTIGSQGDGSPIYKTEISTTTDADGAYADELEWDTYTLDVSGASVLNDCSTYQIFPGSTVDESIMVGAGTTNSLVVTAEDANGAPVPNASVTLFRTGFKETVTATACGTAYFGDLPAESDYALGATNGTISANASNISVSGHTTYDATLQ